MKYYLTASDVLRFWSKVERDPERKPNCWTWHGSHVPSGRPTFWLASQGNNVLAYRVAYWLCRGKIPDDKNLDHQCNNPACVNPFHLEPATQRDNVLRSSGPCAHNAKKMTCKRGHPLVPWSKTGKSAGKPWRKCHICAMESQKLRRKQKAQSASFSDA